MRKTFLFPALLALLVLLSGCRSQSQPAQIAATTLPVYEFTSRICVDTPLTVTRLVTESVSCLHDYSLNVRQVKAAEAAQVVVISGAGLEDFLDGILDDSDILDSSEGIALLHMKKNTTTIMKITTMRTTPTFGSLRKTQRGWPGTSAQGFPGGIPNIWMCFPKIWTACWKIWTRCKATENPACPASAVEIS